MQVSDLSQLCADAAADLGLVLGSCDSKFRAPPPGPEACPSSQARVTTGVSLWLRQVSRQVKRGRAAPLQDAFVPRAQGPGPRYSAAFSLLGKLTTAQATNQALPGAFPYALGQRLCGLNLESAEAHSAKDAASCGSEKCTPGSPRDQPTHKERSSARLAPISRHS